MADQNGPATNDRGIITSGRFVGQHVSTLATYAENLEKELSAKPAVPTPQQEIQQQQQEQTPADRLAQHSSNRISSVGDAATTRLELDDEAEFTRELTGIGVDYNKDWKEKVDGIKSGMNEQIRVAKGVHKMIYMQLRSQDPDTFARLHQAPSAPTPEPEEVKEQVEAAPETPAEVQQEIKAEEPAKPAARAVSPGSVSPTPSARTTQRKKEQPVPLQATSKIERLAAEWGMSTDDYLKRVHARGVTQDDIERESVTRAERPGRMKSVFDRSTATPQ